MKPELQSLESLFQSTTPEDLHRALDFVRTEISTQGTQSSSSTRPLFELVSSLFYIDPLDRPDLAPILDEAISLVIGFGNWVIPAGDLPVETLDAYFTTLRRNLADSNKGVKAKALRSLGKLAKHGHLSPDQKHTMFGIALNLLGEDDEFHWDRNYVVRREAREALVYFES